MRSKLMFAFCFCLFLASSNANAGQRLQSRLLRVSLIQGDVTYQRSDLDKWIDLSINTPILEGDKVWVGRDGRAEIEFEDGSYVRLAENTIIEFSRLGAYSGPRQVEIRLNRGLTTFGVSSGDGSFRVGTPLFSTRILKSATFRLEVEPDSSGRLVVFDGRAEIESQAASLFLRNGEAVRFLSSDPDRYYLETQYVQDDWDRWNSERNEYLAKITRDEQVPFDSGWRVAELNNYGTWYSVPTYGKVWRPHFDADWVPFRSGKWVWYNSFGWTWVSYEPWGWVPYHYGRWAYVGNYGWSWVPGPRYDRWCPGAVSWVEGPSWVGWIPLAPYEPWYAYNHASVNIFISKNYRHRGHVSYLPKDSFLNGTPSDNFRPPRDPLETGRVIPGQPRLSPTLISRMPVVNAYSDRKFTNEDLETRRNLRDRIVQSTAPDDPPNSNPGDQLSNLRNQRDRMMTRGASNVDPTGQVPSSEPGIRIINGGSNIQGETSAESGIRSYNNWGSDREAVRREQRRQVQQQYPTYPGSSDSAIPQSPSPHVVLQPRAPVNHNPVEISPNASPSNPSEGPSSREQTYRVYRSRNEGEVVDRYSIRQQRQSASPQFNNGVPHMPPMPIPSNTMPPAPSSPISQPAYHPPMAHPEPGVHTPPPQPAHNPSPVAHTEPAVHTPPPSAPSSRESVFEAQSGGRDSGSSHHEGRAAVRDR